MQPIINKQIIIPLNNVAYSLHPSIIEPHDGLSSSSSQTLNAVLQSPEILSPSDDQTSPSSLRISVSDVSNKPIYTTQPHFVSSPIAETRRPGSHHRLRGYSDSTGSTERLDSREISSLTRDMTLVAGSSHLSLDPSTRFSHEGATVSSPTCAEDPETPVLEIYPVAPEHFKRHENRRKM